MKSYKDFVSESYSARENLDEGLGALARVAGKVIRGTGNLAWKGAKVTFGSDRGRRIVGGIGAYEAGKNVVKGEEGERNKGHLGSVATGAAAALMPRRGLFPHAGAAALGLHLGDYVYRQMRLREKEKKEKGN